MDVAFLLKLLNRFCPEGTEGMSPTQCDIYAYIYHHLETMDLIPLYIGPQFKMNCTWVAYPKGRV
jgi:hypothetical protein